MREEQRREGNPVHVVLDSAGVDLLELVRLGAQPSSALHRYLTRYCTLAKLKQQLTSEGGCLDSDCCVGLRSHHHGAG